MQDRGRTRLWARTLAVFLAASATVVLAAVDVMDLPPSHINQCPDAYLFEFKSEPGGTGASQEVETFMAKLAVMKSVRVRHEFGTLLNGVSAHVKNPDELREIMGWDIVDNVTPLTIVSPPEQVQPMQNALVTSALNMTGASRVHSELGLKGEGIKVGVIDTGIDYSHPALGGCFGKGCKVAYGYDLVGDKFSGQNTPVPSGNPMDCAGHGTHVAGIVCASDAAVTGVAPEVTLGAYRVLGCEGSTNNDVIIAALERASKDKMDVINLSLGEPNGWTNNPVSRAIAKARSRGILVAAAQGNENTYGLFGTNYVAEGASVLSVASLINTRMALSAFTTSLDPSHPIYYTKKDIGLNGTFLILALLNGTELGTGCEPYQTDLTEVDVGSAKLLSGSISQKAGQKLFELLKSNTKTTGSNITADATATFPEKQDVLVNESGGSASTFSSYGLDNELHLKPVDKKWELYHTFRDINGQPARRRSTCARITALSRSYRDNRAN
ncbi:hypothetical protein BGX26_008948 [Mortierella sp. AD094]|nr:hypothetical protein BGX26_008948 [Mortierella sp. AD094]